MQAPLRGREGGGGGGEYPECLAFSSIVRLGPSPLTCKRMLPSSLVPEGTHSLAGEWAGEPIRTKGQTLWHSRYSVIPLREVIIKPVTKRGKVRLNRELYGGMEKKGNEVEKRNKHRAGMKTKREENIGEKEGKG